MAPKAAVKSRAVDWAGGAQAYYLLVVAVTVLVAIGLLVVASASSAEAVMQNTARSAAEIRAAGGVAGLSDLNAGQYASTLRHIIFIAVGALLATVLSRINYRELIRLAMPGALLIVGLLVFALVSGELNGASRWISIAGVQLQPSEFAKPALLLLAVTVLHRSKVKEGRLSEADRSQLTMAAVVVVASLILIVIAPDKGTALIAASGLFAAYWLLDMPLPRGAWVGGIVGVVGLVAALARSGGYEGDRLGSFFGRWFNGQPPADQVYQAELALGSGKIFGLGPGQSRQKYSWLPESQNDFILAIIGEEYGLVGTLLILATFCVLIWGAWRITLGARDRFGRSLAGGATVMLGVQTLLNIYSVLGIGPVTGKPLPFVTLGGSSILSAFILLGLILSVARYGTQREPEVARSARGGSRQPTQELAPLGARVRTTASRLPADAGRRGPAAERKRASSRSAKDGDGEEVFDEDSLEWWGDSGSRLPRTGGRR